LSWLHPRPLRHQRTPQQPALTTTHALGQSKMAYIDYIRDGGGTVAGPVSNPSGRCVPPPPEIEQPGYAFVKKRNLETKTEQVTGKPE
jgi:hypothetical protein